MQAASDRDKPSNGQSILPAISLAKGGGAIRGIGEKFGANPVTGTASASIPIFTSPGRSGFGPSLSLSYDSGSGNGPFGFGWSLSLPSITRKTEKGLPLYRDVEESDTYILSGSEDLVPELVVENGIWQRSSIPPRTVEFMNDSGILESLDFHIQRYLPRIEGLFARIERWTNLKTGKIHWRSISRDNITTLYGKDEKSRITDPNDPTRIFSWLICESYDDRGNAIVYEYQEEDSTGIDLSRANEKSRSENTRSTNRYIKRIKYGNLPSYLEFNSHSGRPDLSKMKWMFEVVFDYGEHDLEKPSPKGSGKWLCRHDPFSTYRAGFEIRTYRLCQRVLMFHHFPDEDEVGGDCLVRSTDFVYRNIRGNDEDLRKGHPIASFIASVTQNGYRRLFDETGGDKGYLKRSMPPVEFEYSEAIVNDEIKEIDSESLENLPYGIDGKHYQWVDLDGEAVSGILTEQGNAWFYKPNLGGATFGPVEKVAFKPSVSDLGTGGSEDSFMDLAGDGQLDLVRLGGSIPGFFERNHDQRWKNFVPFESIPNVDWNDPNLRMLDLTGGGHPDILVTENEALTWYPSLAERGFGPSVLNRLNSHDEERGPRLVFSDAAQSIYLADLSGDGLTDLVRIRNGEVCYWPNLGYGSFGSKVTMDNSPWFDSPDVFDQARIRLADIDGSGVTDIIYIGHEDGVRLYFNESGNSWAEPVLLANFPHVDNLSSVIALDLLGNGTACLVWSSSLANDTRRPLRYIDLMGGERKLRGLDREGKPRGQKPHLLVKIKNNLGAETQVEYESSTIFYLQDKSAGKPWITKLPFPVHVVKRVKTYDHISRNYFVTRYVYHHGYFDGIEREFRGFGMVEQYDTENFETLQSQSESLFHEGDNLEESTHVPPVVTKTWFHTGIYLGREHVSNFFAGSFDIDKGGEYYREPGLTRDQVQEMLLADTVLPPDLSIEEEREGCRALKGSMLRQEIYAKDGTSNAEHPYTVTEQNFTVRRLQPRNAGNRHAVFFAHPQEVINFHYERKFLPSDPRVQHAATLEVDSFGNVLKSLTIGYGRRHHHSLDSVLLPEDIEKQRLVHITYTENIFTNPILDLDDSYRTRLPAQSSTYELRKPVQEKSGDGPVTELYKFDDLLTYVNQAADGFHDIEYEDRGFTQATNADQYYRRLIEQVRTLYRPDDLGVATDDPLALLPLGILESFAFSGETYKLAFTLGLLTHVFKRDDKPLLLPTPADVLGSGGDRPDQGGYIQSQQFKANGLFPDSDPDDAWWVPAGRAFMSPKNLERASQELEYARKHFFLPLRYRDPFHTDSVSTESDFTLDSYDLLMLRSCDAVDNIIKVGLNDYRVLQPGLVIDPNGNRARIAFDTMGMVTGTAVMGKDDTEGDSLSGFKADLNQDEIDAFYDVSDPHIPAPELLKNATTRIVYDLHLFYRSQNAFPNEPTKWLPTYAATLARETHFRDPSVPAHTPKIQISFSYSDGLGREIEKKIQAEPGPIDEDGPPVNPRWVGSGWTIFNNKGKPVRQYEPFFSRLADRGHWFEFGVTAGVSAILFYDPVERVVATLRPNNTYEKFVLDAWRQRTYDVNDTVAPHDDPHDMQTGDPRTDPDISGFVEKYFAGLVDPTAWKTWFEQRRGGAKGLEEQVAARKAAAHANTPTTAHLDSLGRTFLTMVHNRVERYVVTVNELYGTRIELDIEGNQREVRDAIIQNSNAINQDKDIMGRIVIQYDYDMVGNLIHQLSMDAGARWFLSDVAGKPIRSWDNRGHTFRTEYDPLRRPIRSFVLGILPSEPNRELQTQRIVYGEQHPEEENHNMRGKVFIQLDQAGVACNENYDFKGNLLSSSRQLAKLVQTYKETALDWREVDVVAIPTSAKQKLNLSTLNVALESILEDGGEEKFTGSSLYDALNRPIQIVFPHSSKPGTKFNVSQPLYNEANLLQSIDTWLELESEPDTLLEPRTSTDHFVTNIDYDEKGQRKVIEYGNGIRTIFEYEQETFRLKLLQTVRDRNEKLQDLSYFYDPVGNIIFLHDGAQEDIFSNGQVVKPDSDYTYDAIYRLIKAVGREHEGHVSVPQTTWNDEFRIGLAHPHDRDKMRNYLEVYDYDSVGNIMQVHHLIPFTDINKNKIWIGNWIRKYEYQVPSFIQEDKRNNCLSRTIVHPNAQQPIDEPYAYDLHGNTTSMPHLRVMDSDFNDQLKRVNLGGGGTVYYFYDSSGQRVRKVHEHGALVDERIYLGNFEVYRKYNAIGLKFERETLHIMDDIHRIALVETRTLDTGGNDHDVRQLIRYQLSNHQNSAILEVEDHGNIISYEEYHPYGSTSYQGTRKDLELPIKRYRYTGQERDEGTGFYYHGARYYAPWLGRWTSCDRTGMKNGINLYCYVFNNPVRLTDPNGFDAKEDVLDLIGAAGGASLVGILNRRIEKAVRSSQGAGSEEDSAAHLRVKNMSFDEAAKASAISGNGVPIIFWGLNKVREAEPPNGVDIGAVLALQIGADVIISSAEAPLLHAHASGEEYAKAQLASEQGDIAGAFLHTELAKFHGQIAFASAYLPFEGLMSSTTNQSISRAMATRTALLEPPTSRVLTTAGSRTFRHTVQSDFPPSNAAQIIHSGKLKLSTGANAHYGPGVYAWEAEAQGVGQFIDFRVNPKTAVEQIKTQSGETFYRLVPAEGSELSIEVIGTNFTEEQLEMGRILSGIESKLLMKNTILKRE